uniref:Uncharacterized protein n=1 Tax=Rhabditophanes sp. KR3021 TaxID=114890 RepID=A0AC35TWT0_9BILA
MIKKLLPESNPRLAHKTISGKVVKKVEVKKRARLLPEQRMLFIPEGSPDGNFTTEETTDKTLDTQIDTISMDEMMDYDAHREETPISIKQLITTKKPDKRKDVVKRVTTNDLIKKRKTLGKGTFCNTPFMVTNLPIHKSHFANQRNPMKTRFTKQELEDGFDTDGYRQFSFADKKLLANLIVSGPRLLNESIIYKDSEGLPRRYPFRNR